MVTLSAWVQSWIDRRTMRLAPSTLSGYRRMWRKYVEPSEAGRLEMDAVEPEDLIVMLSPIIAQGHTRAAQLVQVLVGAALRDACRRRVLGWNPMDCVDRVQHHRERTAWLTTEQARQLLKATEGEPFYAAWLLMLCCGLRRGEMLGLKWEDVDLDRRLLHVRRQRIRVDGQILETKPKTEASIREIPLADPLMDFLGQHWGEGCYDLGGDVPTSDKQLEKALDGALNRAKLPHVSLHGLRHTMASTAAGQGILIKVLQEIMGHAQYTTTADVYAHIDRREVLHASKIVAFATFGARLEIA